MESCEDLRERARSSIRVAEHMLTKTYPVVDDPKLILAVAGDIYAALASSMTAVLLAEKEEKAIDADFSARLEAFRGLAGRYGFTDEDIDLIRHLDRIMSEHDDSPVEFPRKDKFVICDENYVCDAISVDDMKSYLFKARLFIEKAEAILESKEMKDKNE